MHKWHAQKLQKATEQREAEEEEIALQHLEAQKVWLLEVLDKRKKAVEVERIRQVEAGEEPSIVSITMDMSAMEYSIIEEQGQFPKALSPEEKKVYSCLVSVEANQIQWWYEALTYLSLLITRVKNVQKKGTICETWENRTRSCGSI